MVSIYDPTYNNTQRLKKIVTLLGCLNKYLKNHHNPHNKLTTSITTRRIITYKGILFTRYNIRLIYYYLYEQYNIVDNMDEWVYTPDTLSRTTYKYIQTKPCIPWSYIYFKGIKKRSGLYYIQTKFNKNKSSCYIGFTSNIPKHILTNHYSYLSNNTLTLTDNGLLIKDGNIVETRAINKPYKYIQVVYNSYSNSLHISYKQNTMDTFEYLANVPIEFKSNNLISPFICYINNPSQRIDFINNI